MKQKKMLERIKQNELIYSRVMALAGDYICMYTVDPENNDYVEYSASDAYKGLGFAKDGKDFFVQATINSESALPEKDYIKFKEQFTKENVINEIRQKGIFTMQYHLIIADETFHVKLVAVLVTEDDVERLIIGVNRLDSDMCIIEKA